MIKYLKSKDFIKRKNFLKKEQLKFIFKFLLLKKEVEKKIKFKIMLKNQRLLNKYFRVQICNRCIISGKMRSVNRITGLARHNFKQYFDDGNLMGFKKSS